ncbi:MAG: hypothetical protein GC154_21730 [bacterium]|nr:hypothetical protein [bacterium]
MPRSWNRLSHLLCLIAFLSACPVTFAARSETGSARLMQGPMIGAAGPREVSIWARAAGPFHCQVIYDQTPEMTNPKRSEEVLAEKSNDYCVVMKVTGLQPGFRYYYRVLVEGGADAYLGKKAPFTFQAAPDGPSRFRVVFGSCSRSQEDPEQPIWRSIADWRPDLFFWLGDNMYGDSLDPDILAEEYRRQRDVFSMRPLIHSIPQLAVWDDHDFGLNDHDGSHPGKARSLEVFKRYWANPAYGAPGVPGVFFTYSYGGVDFFFTDCRYYRSPDGAPDGPGKTMLGAAQLQWLKDELKKSRAPFKVLISGSGWNNGKGPGGDAWSAYLTERDGLFNFIQENRISGVVLLSGDTHVGELNAIPWSMKGGYDLYDLVSSPLAQTPSEGWTKNRPERRIRQVFAASPNAGVLEFDLTGKPVMRFNLIDVYGRTVWDWFELSAAELKNGVQSWPDKIDAESKKRFEAETEGKDYYEP